MSGDDDVSEQEARSRKAGRPVYIPTEAQRQTVCWLKERRHSNAAIAGAIGISRNTLRKAFADELKTVEIRETEQLLDFGGESHKVSEVVNTGGRPEHEPTRRTQEMVKLWALHDWSEDRMARQLGISRNTLRKHYAEEMEFGADAVATEAMLDLKRQSREGKTAASNRLLEQYKLLVPVVEKQGAPDLGKKAQAIVDAKTAHIGTDWDDLMRH